MQTVHEIQDRFDVYVRKLGHSLVMFLFTGSTTANPSFVVMVYETGQLRTVDQNDILVYGNPGNPNSPFIPDIPDGWEPDNSSDKKTLMEALRKREM